MPISKKYCYANENQIKLLFFYRMFIGVNDTNMCIGSRNEIHNRICV